MSQANFDFYSLTPNLPFATKQAVQDISVTLHDGIIVEDAATSSAIFIPYTEYLLTKIRITILEAPNAAPANIVGMITVVGNLLVQVAPIARAQTEIEKHLPHL